MCGRCESEPYRGVAALFSGDLQAKIEYADRADWLVVSGSVIVFLGESALPNEVHPLFRGCEEAIDSLDTDTRGQLEVLSDEHARPAVGAP